jgi:TetR/AcrR family transcriptional regulator, transcriptional repressor for nem operon
MPRSSAHTKDSLTERALMLFWSRGYNATSLDDLVIATGVSRHGIYAAFGGKRSLFLACFAQYQDLVVSPAFARVEAPGANLTTVYDYFDHQITRAESAGLPGPGCFVANSATECAPHDADILREVSQHNRRLYDGFYSVLHDQLTADERADHAWMMVVFTNGLWLTSRVVGNGKQLRKLAHIFLESLERRLTL